MFDAHCHLDRCTERPERVLERAWQAGVNHLVVAGVERKRWANQTALSGPGVHIAWGVHPWRVAEAPEQWPTEYRALCRVLENPPIQPVAIGETGLDYGRRIDPDSHLVQKEAFRMQLRLAKEHGLPVILHIVRAHNDAAQILKEEGVQNVGGMVHSFSGNPEQAKAYLRMNLHISFAGNVVDPNNKRVRKAAASIPDDRLLVETDSPDQTPKTRKPLPNEPAFLIDVISAVAELRDQTSQHVTSTTTANAHALFGIPTP